MAGQSATSARGPAGVVRVRVRVPAPARRPSPRRRSALRPGRRKADAGAPGPLDPEHRPRTPPASYSDVRRALAAPRSRVAQHQRRRRAKSGRALRSSGGCQASPRRLNRISQSVRVEIRGRAGNALEGHQHHPGTNTPPAGPWPRALSPLSRFGLAHPARLRPDLLLADHQVGQNAGRVGSAPLAGERATTSVKACRSAHAATDRRPAARRPRCSRPSTRSAFAQVGQQPPTCRAAASARPRARRPGVADRGVSPRVAQVIERLHQAAGLRGQVGDRLASGSRLGRSRQLPHQDRLRRGPAPARRPNADQVAQFRIQPAPHRERPGQGVQGAPRHTAPAASPRVLRLGHDGRARRAPPPRPGSTASMARRSGTNCIASGTAPRCPTPHPGGAARPTAPRPARGQLGRSSRGLPSDPVRPHPAPVSSRAQATAPRSGRSGPNASRGHVEGLVRPGPRDGGAHRALARSFRKLVDGSSLKPDPRTPRPRTRRPGGQPGNRRWRARSPPTLAPRRAWAVGTGPRPPSPIPRRSGGRHGASCAWLVFLVLISGHLVTAPLGRPYLQICWRSRPPGRLVGSGQGPRGPPGRARVPLDHSEQLLPRPAALRLFSRTDTGTRPATPSHSARATPHGGGTSPARAGARPSPASSSTAARHRLRVPGGTVHRPVVGRPRMPAAGLPGRRG